MIARVRLAILLALVALGLSVHAGAPLDVNQATVAQLDGLKGVGPALSGRILDARAQAPFKDWADLQARVKGLGEASARRLSVQGLRVNGQALAGH